MLTKIQADLYAFLWESNRENNSNTFLILGDKTILIDPGYGHLFGEVRRGLSALNLSTGQIDVVLATHAHPDHLDAMTMFRKPTLSMMGQEDFLYFTKLASLSFPMPEPDILLQAGELDIGRVRLQVLVTPGHSPGSLCLYWPEKKALFCGDVAFEDGIGTTDLPGGDGKLMKESLIRISQLDVEVLLPGHGNVVVGREAVRRNFERIESFWFSYL
ncbi:MAG: putative polyketide biosynthesis zinc-dependent hydrolase PksB [Syntrophus sp. PtaU1.Bin005]|jgi:glyoxylase-like metal-dependent hydrolase (beta-lactamase superfamily II)|uniref:MBL fold metallo-hydrolase n=1 Tax=Syntrophus TaxID=43773 RepID=UPI0009CD65FF|nr:MAG: putative polyketide biosynthesis zinc-dependent hydrolase PksB [Syntrophus sp. PtaB.Bin138]OPY80518.1 MAG: putative polyketide biosynthesis zinc-dependent hydrolase PksB [Syntrophus sp. PtaU1.Bin005]